MRVWKKVWVTKTARQSGKKVWKPQISGRMSEKALVLEAWPLTSDAIERWPDHEDGRASSMGSPIGQFIADALGARLEEVLLAQWGCSLKRVSIPDLSHSLCLRLTVMRPRDYGLDPLKVWVKLALSSSKVFLSLILSLWRGWLPGYLVVRL